VSSELGPLEEVAVPYRFENLPSFTRKEVLLWNWYCRAVPAGGEWRAWVAEILGHFVQKPAGYQIQLTQTHLVETKFGEKTLIFGSKQEVILGRSPENDVVLTAGAIARKHARLFLKDGALFLEDQGGALGTYLWDTRLSAGDTQRLRNGDQFTIFPYRFRVLVECTWTPETDIILSEIDAQLITRGEHFRRTPPGLAAFILEAQPSGDNALIDFPPEFLHGISQRVYGPIGLQPAKTPVPSDDTLLGFILFAALEHLNKRVQSPLRFRFARGTHIGAENSRGVSLSVVLRVGELTGDVRIFLPLGFLYSSGLGPVSGAARYPEGLSWKFPVSAGFVDFFPEEMDQVVPGDVLLVQQSPTLLIASESGKGWAMTALESNFTSFSLDKYIDGGVFVAKDAEAEQTASQSGVESLPVRLHVVLAEKELTLTQIQGFVPGTIIELDAGKFEPVQLMVNGRILGEGELVEVEGTLAVKVVRWRNS
jgi:flagellar motor switch/type III secretory pathway protein FliN